MFEIRNTDPNKLCETAPNRPLRDIIEIDNLFHMTRPPHGVTYFISRQDDNYNITFPSKWELYCDETFICNMTLIGTMSKTIVNPRLLTIITEGHIDKSLFNFDKKMYFKRIADTLE